MMGTVVWRLASRSRTISAAVLGEEFPRSGKARQLVPSMLSLTQGPLKVVSDALQAGLLGWSRLNRRYMALRATGLRSYPWRGRSDRRAGTAPRLATSGNLLSRSRT